MFITERPFEAEGRPAVCVDGRPLTFAGVAVQKQEEGAVFDLRQWKGQGDGGYSLSVASGQITSSATSHRIY